MKIEAKGHYNRPDSPLCETGQSFRQSSSYPVTVSYIQVREHMPGGGARRQRRLTLARWPGDTGEAGDNTTALEDADDAAGEEVGGTGKDACGAGEDADDAGEEDGYFLDYSLAPQLGYSPEAIFLGFGYSGVSVFGIGGQGVFYPGTWVAV
ncbi:hypothetical protein U9M48_040728 [Paspalum notatum var. saurae]|uniref:Uncharacterized protein n=1 Tax=Paspalum notatum var. saurae TaxID=547442 RepID=A0AAQ3UP26_PASNO